MDEQWVLSLRDQCKAANVPFFYKQRLDGRGKKVSMPELEGQQWAECPEMP
jgi:protein gp37